MVQTSIYQILKKQAKDRPDEVSIMGLDRVPLTYGQLINQAEQQSREFELWLNRKRLRIEGLFNEVQNVGKNLERLLSKTAVGLCSRIVAKMTSHLLKFILRYIFCIDVLTFSKVPR
jgi:hypothetical protein